MRTWETQLIPDGTGSELNRKIREAMINWESDQLIVVCDRESLLHGEGADRNIGIVTET